MNQNQLPSDYQSNLSMFSEQIQQQIKEEFENKTHIKLFNAKAEIRELEKTIKEYNELAKTYESSLKIKCDKENCNCGLCVTRQENLETYKFAVKQRDALIEDYQNKVSEFKNNFLIV